MEISTAEIHEYLNCPVRHKFIFKDKIDPTPGKSILFKQAVHRTIYYFFFTAMNGYVPKISQMKDKWASVWKEASGDGPPIDDILSVRLPIGRRVISNQQVSDDKYKMSGFEMIHNFHHFNKDNPGNVIAVDFDYRVPIGDAIVTGKFELVREIVDSEDKKRYIEVVDFKTSSDDVEPFLVKNDFDLTIASYAFRNLFNSKEDRVKYHYLKTGRDIIIKKTDEDFNRMKAIVKGVHTAIKDNQVYPRQTHMCKSCEFKDLCDRSKF